MSKRETILLVALLALWLYPAKAQAPDGLFTFITYPSTPWLVYRGDQRDGSVCYIGLYGEGRRFNFMVPPCGKQ